jgi:hypothetical protein
VIKNIFLGIPIFLFFLYLSTILTLPKEGVWYKFEEFAQKESLVISGDEVRDNFINLNISNGEILFRNLSIANFGKITIYPFVFLNRIEIRNLRTGKDISQFGDYIFTEVTFNHDISAPEKIFFKGEGNFGKLNGRINVKKREIDVLLFPNKKTEKNKQLMKNFKKDDSLGGYLYYGSF